MSGFWNAATMRQRIEREHLVAPFKPERVVSGSYELSLGPEIFLTSDETGTKREIAMGEQVRIRPGQFANLLTEEVVSVPRDALGLISIKFGFKQPGLVNVSGFHVDPGYSGRLLFSVYNAGPQTVVIARGDAVFLLWFAAFDHPTADEDMRKKPVRDSITSEDVQKLQGEIATPQALAERVRKLEQFQHAFIWVSATIAAALITLFVARAGGLLDNHPSGTTTTTRMPASTTSVPGATTRVPTEPTLTVP
jgi:dCTP deaminase